LINHPVVDDRRSGEKHEAQYCLDLLKEIGITSALDETFVPVHPESELWADQFLRQNGIDEDEMLVALHFGASDPSKCWPEESFVQLIEQLIEKYSCKIVIIGAKNMRSTARKIVGLTYGPIFDVTGMTTVSQLVSLLGRSSLLISNDSGPVHIAAALQTPVVSIFTRNQPGINPERWKPLGLNSTYVAVQENLSPSFKKAGETDVKNLEVITPQAVLEAVDDVFKLC
jgi:ADP-heptose:LPS heptosyltransferase